MKTNRNFGIIGGDIRQYYLAKSLMKDGHSIAVFGFEKIAKEDNNLKELSLPQLIDTSDYIVFPVPITRNNQTLNAPFAKNEIYIDEQLLNSLEGKKVFGGIIISSIEKYVKNNKFSFYDYYREDFIIPNAVLTAEGAVKVFLENSLKSVNKSNCLVLGYGRIGKILCKILKNLGANVTATARNIKDRASIECEKYDFIHTNKLISDKNLNFYDVIFNTVPAVILDENILKKLSSDTIIIDLASNSGGTDSKAAKKLNLKFFHELGIPGRYFPKSAGEIIKNTIYQIITEENI